MTLIFQDFIFAIFQKFTFFLFIQAVSLKFSKGGIVEQFTIFSSWKQIFNNSTAHTKIFYNPKNIVCFFKRVDLTLHFLTIVLIKT